jgi:hypothetical protein
VLEDQQEHPAAAAAALVEDNRLQPAGPVLGMGPMQHLDLTPDALVLSQQVRCTHVLLYSVDNMDSIEHQLGV